MYYKKIFSKTDHRNPPNALGKNALNSDYTQYVL